jgi:hypothetical protein
VELRHIHRVCQVCPQGPAVSTSGVEVEGGRYSIFPWEERRWAPLGSKLGCWRLGATVRYQQCRTVEVAPLQCILLSSSSPPPIQLSSSSSSSSSGFVARGSLLAFSQMRGAPVLGETYLGAQCPVPSAQCPVPSTHRPVPIALVCTPHRRLAPAVCYPAPAPAYPPPPLFCAARYRPPYSTILPK